LHKCDHSINQYKFMFSRYVFYTGLEDLEQKFNVKKFDIPDFQANYNIGYGNVGHIIIAGQNREHTLTEATWDATPFSELSVQRTVLLTDLDKKPVLTKCFQRKRCIILLNGYYEWKHLNENLNIPFYLRLLSRDLFGVAGLFDRYVDDKGNTVTAFVPFETASNEVVQPLSDTMPAILSKKNHVRWLDPLTNDTEVLTEMIRPIEMLDMASYRVTNKINDKDSRGKELIQPVV
jgi:putative SOS response-associated peptidase YedK